MTRSRAVLRLVPGAAAAALFGLSARDAAAEPACTTPKTTCVGTGGYYASSEDLSRVTAVTDPLLQELRACLDAAGGKHVSPTVLIRWDADTNPVSIKVDAPGYDSLPCVGKVAGKLSQLHNPHETAIRCDYGCDQPAPPAAPPPPPPPPLATATPPPAQPPPAQRQPAPPPPPYGAADKPAPKYEKTWYGWQTLIADGAAIAMYEGGRASTTAPLKTAGIMTFFLGTPILHMIHGNVGAGFGSAGLRFALPGLGALVGLFAGIASSNASSADARFDDAADAVAVGVLVGAIGCALIDAGAVAYAKERVDTASVRLPARTKLTLVPSLRITSDRASMGLGGSF
jgi:hypothetical protein